MYGTIAKLKLRRTLVEYARVEALSSEKVAQSLGKNESNESDEMEIPDLVLSAFLELLYLASMIHGMMLAYPKIEKA